MSQVVEAEMSRQGFAIAYKGKGRPDDHSIDVESLAPALMAFCRLIREANHEFNGKRSTAKVLVSSDFESRCFYIQFDTVVTYYDQIKTILGFDGVKTAKEILEWIGLVKSSKIGALSFIEFLRLKKGRKAVVDSEISEKTPEGSIILRIEGDHNLITVYNHVYQLSTYPKALAAVRDALTPLGQDGFDTFEVRDGASVLAEIPPQDAQAIIASCHQGIDEAKDETPDLDVTTAWIQVYSPVYDESATKWRFRLGREIVSADISETKIAHDALLRGGALANDSYQVRLEVTTPKAKSGKQGKSSFKILAVVKFVPANPESQGQLFTE